MCESTSGKPAGQGVLHLQQSVHVKHGLKGQFRARLMVTLLGVSVLS